MAECPGTRVKCWQKTVCSTSRGSPLLFQCSGITPLPFHNLRSFFHSLQNLLVDQALPRHSPLAYRVVLNAQA